MWLPELGLYYYKARAYAPHLGRFLQTDPIGYEDSANLYAYVGNDPVNFIDPLGLKQTCGVPGTPDCEDTVTRSKEPNWSEINLPSFPFDLLDLDSFAIGGEDGVTRTPSPRSLTPAEKRILKCNGATQKSVDTFSVSNFMPPAFYLNPGVDAVTLPLLSLGRSRAGFRGGIPDIGRSLDDLALFAHEFAHHLQYRQGMTIAAYLLDVWNTSYLDSKYEVTARDFAEKVFENRRSGKCL